MKKLIVILSIMLIVVGAVFAEGETSQRLTLQSDVAEKKPAFLFQGGEDTAEDHDAAVVTTVAGKYDGTLIETEKSIADEDITLKFKIVQKESEGVSGQTKYARYKGVVTFTVAVGALKQQAPIAANEVAAEVAGAIDVDSLTAGTPGTYTSNNSPVANKITLAKTQGNDGFTAAYNGKVMDGQVIGTFTATWVHDETLPNGTYKADITLTISAV